MDYEDRVPVTDVDPWPDGRGYQGGAAWWEYARAQPESKRLNMLIGLALTHRSIRNMLLAGEIDDIAQRLGLSQATCYKLRHHHATTLQELAQHLLRAEAQDETALSATFQE
ncbi:MAG: hypothetical protein ACLFTK_00265 [Anaerolineales bacterium]